MKFFAGRTAVLLVCLLIFSSFAIGANKNDCKEALESGVPHGVLKVDATFDRPDAKPNLKVARQWSVVDDGSESVEKRVARLASLVNGLISGDAYPGHETYREAILYLARNRSTLKEKVFVHLPGGLMPNREQFWASVKAQTKDTCNCGNEREITPLTSLIASNWVSQDTPNLITLKLNDKIYIRPVGSNEVNTIASFEIGIEAGQSYLEPVLNPLAPLTMNGIMSLFSKQVYPLAKLEPHLTPGKPIEMAHATGSDPATATKLVFVRLVSADSINHTLTIELAKGAEVFTPIEKTVTREN